MAYLIDEIFTTRSPYHGTEDYALTGKRNCTNDFSRFGNCPKPVLRFDWQVIVCLNSLGELGVTGHFMQWLVSLKMVKHPWV